MYHKKSYKAGFKKDIKLLNNNNTAYLSTYYFLSNTSFIHRITGHIKHNNKNSNLKLIFS